MVTRSRIPARAGSRVFRAIADPTRRAIIECLRDGGESTVESIAARFPISRPGVSKHLAVLARASLVRVRRRGRERRYRLDPRPLERVDAWVAAFRLDLASSMVRVKEHAERLAVAAGAPGLPSRSPPSPLPPSHSPSDAGGTTP